MRSLKYILCASWICAWLSGCALLPTAPKASTPSAPEPTRTAVRTTAEPPPTATPLPEPQPAPTRTPTGAWIRLTPASGTPGTAVEVDGYFPDAPEAKIQNDGPLTHADACWGGCQTGLREAALAVTWSARDPGHFSLQIAVPSAPWLAADGLHPLTPGDYPVEVLFQLGCVPSAASGKTCSTATAAGAAFHLEQGYRGPECQSGSCGQLELAPAQAAPGETVRVTGFAPLLELIVQPFGYDLAIETKPAAVSSADLIYLGPIQQALDGSLTASFQAPQQAGGAPLAPGTYILALEAMGLPTTASQAKGAPPKKGSPPLLVAPTPFTLLPAPAWTARQRGAPLWIQPSSGIFGQGVAVDPAHPERIAACRAGSIQLSQDGGQTWASIPIRAVQNLALPGDLEIDPSQSTCQSVTLDSNHPDSFYAVFGAFSRQWGAPPVYYLGFFTPDRGKTWQLAPVTQAITQPTMTAGTFGGFSVSGDAVQALYFDTTGNDPANPPPLRVKQTKDGGLTWTQASLACPESGPCLRWGPAPSEVAGMGSGLPQDVKASFDQGRDWVDTGQSAELRMDGPHQLAALSQSEALLISGSASYPLLYTPDSGKTWQALGLPQLPGASSGWGYNGFYGLQILPGGSLLALNQDTGVWWALPPAAAGWCATRAVAPGKFPTPLNFAGGRVWWLDPTTGQPASAPASQFACQP